MQKEDVCWGLLKRNAWDDYFWPGRCEIMRRANDTMKTHTTVSQSTVSIFHDAETARLDLVDRIKKAKPSFVTRRVDFNDVHGLCQTRAPRAGDLLLASIADLAHHPKLELPSGRRAQLYPGDEIVVAFGARYAPDQFEAVVPDRLGVCDLVAAGGIAARVVSRHSQTRKATSITPLGILVDSADEALNLRRYALPAPAPFGPTRNVIAVVGTSMNAGKTTLASSIIRGLNSGGVRVGACKVTGTGAGGDLWSMRDAGAMIALDFTDVGFATTSGLAPETTARAAVDLISHVEANDVDVIVVEVADGLLQRETSALLSPPCPFAARLDTVILAAADSMGAKAGADWLTARGLPLRAISGLVTASPLAAQEAQNATGLEVIASSIFADPDYAARLCLATPPQRLRAAL